MPFREPDIDAGLLRVCDGDGITRGTAFLITNDGLALTCHHVVDGFENLQLQTNDGQSHEAEVGPDDVFPALDLALIRSPVLDAAMPVGTNHQLGDRYWTKGYQYQSYNVRSALPAFGTIESFSAHIAYRATSEYDIEGALVLSGETFNEGLSGSPVVDPNEGVTLAVVTAGFEAGRQIAGYGIPLSLAIDRWPALADAVERNGETIPRYGRFMNGLTARELCRRQCERATDWLIGNETVLVDSYVPRRAIRKHLDRFLNRDHVLLPIIGQSGVGKTTELAMYAREAAADTPLVFIRAAALASEDGDLSAELDAQLRQVAPAGARVGVVDDVLATLADQGEQLVICLDGLNELRRPVVDRLDVWFERTLNWLGSKRARLILTCRPDYWDQWRRFLPTASLYAADDPSTGDAPKRGDVLLEGFSDEEASAALEAYGLAASPLSRNDVSHPMLARIYWERVRRGTGGGPLSRYDALDEFVEVKCGDVARLHGLADQIFVRDLVSGAAKAMLDQRELWLTVAQFRARFRDHLEIATLLLREHVLTQTADACRFTFDEVAEFLQAQHVAADQILELLQRGIDENSPLRLGTVRFALLRLERSGQGDEFVSILSELVDRYQEGGPSSIAFVLANTFVDATERYPTFDLMLRFARATMTRDHEYIAAVRVARDAPLPRDKRLALLRTLVPAETSFWWEPKHWDLDPNRYGHRYSPESVLSREMGEDSRSCVRELAGWLDDGTPLRGSNATVADFAGGVLYHHADTALDQLVELLPSLDLDLVSELVHRLSGGRPDVMTAAARRWFRSNDVSQQTLALQAATWLLAGADKQSFDEQVLPAIEELYRSASVPAIRARAMSLLLLRPTSRRAVLPAAVKAFLSDDPWITPAHLSEDFDSDTDAVLDALEYYIFHGRVVSRRVQAIDALARDGPSHQRDRAASLLLRILDDQGGEGEIADAVGWAVERMLDQVDAQTPATSDQVRLMMRVATDPRAGLRRHVWYFAAEPATSGSAQDLRRRLFDLALETERDDNNLSVFVAELARRRDDLDIWLPPVIELTAHVDQESLEGWLFGAAWHYPTFAEHLARWLPAYTSFRARFAVAEFLAAVERGTPPPDAADEAMKSE